MVSQIPQRFGIAVNLRFTAHLCLEQHSRSRETLSQGVEFSRFLITISYKSRDGGFNIMDGVCRH